MASVQFSSVHTVSSDILKYPPIIDLLKLYGGTSHIFILYVSPIIILFVVLSTRSHRLWVPLLLEI